MFSVIDLPEIWIDFSQTHQSVTLMVTMMLSVTGPVYVLMAPDELAFKVTE